MICIIDEFVGWWSAVIPQRLLINEIQRRRGSRKKVAIANGYAGSATNDGIQIGWIGVITRNLFRRRQETGREDKPAAERLRGRTERKE